MLEFGLGADIPWSQELIFIAIRLLLTLPVHWLIVQLESYSNF